MNAARFTSFGLVAVTLSAFVFTGWKFLSTARQQRTLVASARQIETMGKELVAVEEQRQASGKSAEETERDNAILRQAMDKFRATKAPPPALETVEARFQKAEALAKSGKDAAALQELLECYDALSRMSFSVARTRLRKAVVEAIGKLAERYPTAMAALRDRFERAHQRLFGPGDPDDAVAELVSLAKNLKDERALISIYDEIADPDDPRRARLGIYAFQQLVDLRRYRDALVSRPYSMMSSGFERDIADAPSIPQTGTERNSRRDDAIKTAVLNIEILAGVGDLEHTRSLAERLLQFDSSAATRSVLQSHLERAGHPELLDTLSRP